MEFIKDYGSILISAIAGVCIVVWKAFCIVKQIDMINHRLDVLEKQFEKLDVKLDAILNAKFEK